MLAIICFEKIKYIMFNIHAYSFVKIVMILHTFSVTVVFKRILDGTRTGTKTQTDNAINYSYIFIVKVHGNWYEVGLL